MGIKLQISPIFGSRKFLVSPLLLTGNPLCINFNIKQPGNEFENTGPDRVYRVDFY